MKEIKGIKKIIATVIITILLGVVLTACTQVDRVSENIRQQADNFNITRRIVVINARSDKPVFELTGNFSLQNNLNNELEIIVETEKRII